jgi:hypothetical protein
VLPPPRRPRVPSPPVELVPARPLPIWVAVLAVAIVFWAGFELVKATREWAKARTADRATPAGAR